MHLRSYWTTSPSSMFRANRRYTRKWYEICSNLTLLWCPQGWLWTEFAIFSNVSNFDFEQVNAAWEEASRMRKLSLTKYSLPEIINTFIAIVPIFSLLKTPVNHWFSGVLRGGYKMGILARKVLNIHDNYFFFILQS